MSVRYVPTIGMETHAQLLTESKLFCPCSTRFGAPPNHNVCPVCLGFPGSLPKVNFKAVDFVARTARALHCDIAPHSRFARKNYYYPDLPKAYQISQYELPIGANGWIDVESAGEIKRIRIHRIHLEEDAGKLVHGNGETSFVDYNRGGVPLMEIVTEPDIESSEQAAAYLIALRSVLQYLEVCDGNMEEGSMRCEPNVSVRPEGQEKLGTKTELKNINSFRSVQRGVEFEIARQRDLLESGGRVTQETRRWDEEKQKTVVMRSKEEAHDYRYFPDPDLPPLRIDAAWLDRVDAAMPELPAARRSRFIERYGLVEQDAGALTAARPLADYFEACAQRAKNPKTACNWIANELLGRLNESGGDIRDCKIHPHELAGLLEKIEDGAISGKIAKTVFDEMFETGASAASIIESRGLVQITDRDGLEAVAARVIEANPGPAADYRSGKEKALGRLVGMMMKETQGKANPQLCNDILKGLLQP